LNILNELKGFSSIIITRDGMNLRCAEKILEKIKYDLYHIREAKKFLKIEKFVDSEEIEVCITTRDELKEKLKNDKNKKNKEVKVINAQPEPAILIRDGTKCEHRKISEISNNEVDENESDLVCRHIKYCIKIILKGLNLLNNKDFTYLNMATSSDKFFTALKYILEDIGELEEMKYKIPLKWYGHYISNNKSYLNKSYIENDYELLYDEIYNEELNILNELKLFSSILITRDVMNLRCAEKFLEKIKYDLKHIKEAIKFIKIEKFVNTEEIEVCIKTREMDDYYNRNKKDRKIVPKYDEKNNLINPAIIITDGTKCEHKVVNVYNINIEELDENTNQDNNKDDKDETKKIPCHSYYIKDFINKFSNNAITKDKTVKFQTLSQLVKEDLLRGNRNNQIYVSIDTYIDIVKQKNKEDRKKQKTF
jgi:hypothetical protein